MSSVNIPKFFRYVLALACAIIFPTPVLLLRLFSVVTAKTISTLGRRLSAISCRFAIDNIYTHPTGTLALFIMLDKKVELETIRKTCIRLLDSNKHPELKQKLSRWMGFFFWEDASNFHISNHLSEITGGPISDEDVEQLRRSLVKKPFLKDQPLWEFLLYPLLTSTGGSVVVLRVHHCLVDGFSLLLLINDFANGAAYHSIRRRKFETLNWLQKGVFNLQLFLKGPGLLLETISNCQDVNAWKAPKEILTGEYDTCQKRIDLQYVKDIARKRNSLSSAVIFAAFTGAMRNLMIKLSQKVPQDITVIFPLPLPNHPDYLTNHQTMVPVKAPVAISNSAERLKYINSQYDSLKTSLIPYAFGLMMQISGLIASLTKSEKRSNLGTVGMSNFAGPEVAGEIFGAVAVDFSFASGLMRSGFGVLCSSFSYNGKLVLTARADTGIFPCAGVTTEFLNLVVEELRILNELEDC